MFIVPFAIHLVCLPVLALLNDYTLPWQSWLTPAEDGLYHSPEARSWGVLTTGGLAFRIFQNAFVGIILVSIFAFFEEMGWRAWMLPRLVNRFNLRTGVLVSSIIWALWHIPFVLGGIHHIEGTPMLALLLLNPLGHIGAGNVIGWLWIRTRSIWLVTLAHGALNNWGQYAFKYMADGPGENNIWLLVALNLTLFTVGIAFLLRLKRQSDV
ncbi:MAG: CPBP family intramembrane metalloprotease [Caldithrix sp.]|nr:MAG: CPBP family intramembrane metalloprotease [Caldithrix sp.]